MEVTSAGNFTRGDAVVTLHYTDKPRRFKAGTLAIGDPAFYLEGERIQNNKTSAFICSRQCTEFFNGSINLFASHLMSGRYGRDIILRKTGVDGFNSTVIQQVYIPPPLLLLTRPLCESPGLQSNLCDYDVRRFDFGITRCSDTTISKNQ